MQLGDEIISIEDWDVESGPGGRRLPEQLDPVDWGLDMIDQAAMPLNRVYAYESLGALCSLQGTNMPTCDPCACILACAIQVRCAMYIVDD